MANLICAKCNKKIDESNLIECPFCWEMYHKECWEETKFCLSCKKYNPDFARIQEEKKMMAMENKEDSSEEKTQIKKVEEDELNEEQLFEMPTREMNHSPIANTMMLISKVALIIGVVAGIAVAAQAFVDSYYFAGKVIGIILGLIVAAIGWVVSVLVNGFAEVINNTQKSAYYLSKLVEKEKKDSDK